MHLIVLSICGRKKFQILTNHVKILQRIQFLPGFTFIAINIFGGTNCPFIYRIIERFLLQSTVCQ